MFSSKILGLIAVGAIFIATNPKEKETFANQLQEKTKKESGFIAGWAAKGMALLDLFTIEDHIFFSLAFLNPPPHSTDSVVAIAKVHPCHTYNQSPLVAIGILNNWFFVQDFIRNYLKRI
ncbi:hypothetical protein DDB_G0269652 [Dictyostelium discoideum AX4]|uniref:Uncharacterized protein n=1 Tax=Dictyostelium discoideum TaxID=44689 RepID=Q55DI2_DICDI|nr:hypothetical protein DDB_G0269652 [Dictyostelium discoideum AX4]EAL72176.1 hypothetical protein DDB_G0269652 [Dictyostelium discoideum AX4]|eukprot:XP_646149.1 hypothetical protein DDB_G0269652 [Dictyostelium discoideum AX4]